VETENSSLTVLVAGVPQMLQNLSFSFSCAPHFVQYGKCFTLLR